MIKILHVVPSLDPGGMERGIINVAHRLNPAKFRVDVCCLETRGALADTLPDHTPLYVLNKQPGISPRTCFQLGQLISQTNPDIVHTHTLGPLLYGGGALLFCGRQAVVQGEHRELMSDELTPSKLMMRHLLYHACRQVHTVSHALRTHLIQLGFPADKIVAIPNGVDTTRYSPGNLIQARHAIHLPPTDPVIGIVGRLRPEKNHRLLMEAFHLIHTTLPNAHLLIVGDGPELKALTAFASSLPCAARIHFAGHQQDPAGYYRAMDMMVLPSQAEGLSNAILEAMACGVPVITTSVCGSADIIRHDYNGWLIDRPTPQTLAAIIEFNLNRPDPLSRISTLARDTVISRFSMPAMVGGYEALYQSVVSQ